MSDTDLDVSSLASADDGVLVFPEDGEEEEEEEEDDYETEEEEELLFEEESEERARSSPPFLLVPEEDLELGRSSIAITVPQVETPREYKDDEKVSVASSFVSSVEGGAAIGESIFRDEEHEGEQPRPSSLQPPRAHSKKSMASSPGSGPRSVSFNTPIQTSITFNASNTTSRREEKKPMQLPSSVIHKQRSSSRMIRSSRTPSPAFSPVDIVDGRQRQNRRSIVKKKRRSHRKKHAKPMYMIPTFEVGQGLVIPTDNHLKSSGRSGGGKKKHGKKNKRDIAVSGVPQFSDLEDEDEDDYYAPPKHLSPRSAAQYVKDKLKEGAKRRKKTRSRRKGQKSSEAGHASGGASGDGGKKKRSKRKGKKKGHRGKKKKSRKEKALSSDDEVSLRPGRKPVGPAEQHFNPVPRSLYKKRCLFSAEANPLQCTICNGIHYRTKRNFAANLRIIMNVNAALTGILNEMRNRMKKIDSNLARVKRNLEFMEDLYEGVFRKVNRLIS